MLQLKGISKRYQTGSLIQQALDGVTLNLRDNEFVAVLGPSGSGKTTLLNIIGGLDRYDEGELIINGISTKKYKSRDWDSYRNHTVGFVFQSYNLIPHQSILANVELALTISGIGRGERRKRAMKALEDVGLADQAHKRPGQMSGGQMQRVAIARALVNDPDIVLADEPTGALDSETSLQVMDLLKKVAKDRLVVMVTHNPDLAEKYANRIVRLYDGKIISDTNHYDAAETVENAPVHKNMGKASMSFLTAFSLSLNNLWTKKARTILTALAGSIGIIGIALILSLSTGANDYIETIEEDTMSEYPVEITSSGFDISAMMVGLVDDVQGQEDSEVGVTAIVTDMFSTMNTNDLAALKEFIDEDGDDIHSYTRAIEYVYDVTPQIYRLTDDGGVRQVNPDESFSALGFGSGASSSSLISSMMSTNVFYQMPSEPDLYEDQYEVKAGRWPEAYNECVLVLSSGGGITDFLLYTLGLRDAVELDTMIQQFINEEDIEKIDITTSYSYEDFIGISFKLVNSFDYYEYDSEYDVWIDKTDNDEYMRQLVENGEDITIVGVVQPLDVAVATALSSGINYPASLSEHIAAEAAASDIVKQQLADPGVDVFTGEAFGSSDGSEIDMDSLFSIDMDSIIDAFSLDLDMDLLFDPDSIADSFEFDESSFDLSGLADFSDMQLDMSDMTDTSGISDMDFGSMMSGIDVSVSEEAIADLVTALLTGYEEYSAQNPAADYTQIGSAISEYLSSDEGMEVLQGVMADILAGSEFTITADEMSALSEGLMEGYLEYIGEQGYTDADMFGEYFIEYLQTDEALAFITGQVGAMFTGSSMDISEEELEGMSEALMEGYSEYAKENDLPDPMSMSQYIMEYISSDAVSEQLADGIYSIIDIDSLESQMTAALQDYMTAAMGSMTDAMSEAVESQISQMTSLMVSQMTESITGGMETAMEDMMSELESSMADILSLDEDTFTEAFGMNMDQTELTELLTSLLSAGTASYDGNLELLGYADFASPTEIDIYPTDFTSKGEITAILDNYNRRMEEQGEPEKVISYTDIVGTLMSSVTDIINIISYLLIAFVAISLIVSSIMIGVITYISVLERKKEIGILRAMGASKGNISSVFNAETFIIGLAAGILGIVVSRLILIPGNRFIHRLAGTTAISAILPVNASLLLILLSVVLTVVAGLIPSRQAARSDPVSALRVD